jgi:hypothetical protein
MFSVPLPLTVETSVPIRIIGMISIFSLSFDRIAMLHVCVMRN